MSNPRRSHRHHSHHDPNAHTRDAGQVSESGQDVTTATATTTAIPTLVSMFPTIDRDVIASVWAAVSENMDAAINALLEMSDPTHSGIPAHFDTTAPALPTDVTTQHSQSQSQPPLLPAPPPPVYTAPRARHPFSIDDDDDVIDMMAPSGGAIGTGNGSGTGSGTGSVRGGSGSGSVATATTSACGVDTSSETTAPVSAPVTAPAPPAYDGMQLFGGHGPGSGESDGHHHHHHHQHYQQQQQQHHQHHDSAAMMIHVTSTPQQQLEADEAYARSLQQRSEDHARRVDLQTNILRDLGLASPPRSRRHHHHHHHRENENRERDHDEIGGFQQLSSLRQDDLPPPSSLAFRHDPYNNSDPTNEEDNDVDRPSGSSPPTFLDAIAQIFRPSTHFSAHPSSALVSSSSSSSLSSLRGPVSEERLVPGGNGSGHGSSSGNRGVTNGSERARSTQGPTESEFGGDKTNDGGLGFPPPHSPHSPHSPRSPRSHRSSGSSGSSSRSGERDRSDRLVAPDLDEIKEKISQLGQGAKNSLKELFGKVQTKIQQARESHAQRQRDRQLTDPGIDVDVNVDGNTDQETRADQYNRPQPENGDTYRITGDRDTDPGVSQRPPLPPRRTDIFATPSSSFASSSSSTSSSFSASGTSSVPANVHPTRPFPHPPSAFALASASASAAAASISISTSAVHPRPPMSPMLADLDAIPDILDGPDAHSVVVVVSSADGATVTAEQKDVVHAHADANAHADAGVEHKT